MNHHRRLPWIVALTALFSLTAGLAISSEPHSADDFYKHDEVQSVRLEILPTDRQKMLDALPERIYVPATFHWRDVELRNVGVRFKGNSSSNPRQQHKRSYLIKFDKYHNGQRFLGLRRASFDNAVQFGSVFSEPIITEILADIGLPTHRANYAGLVVNERFEGIFVNVERIDETFIANQLGDSRGSLFKVDEGGPGANLQFLGQELAPYRRTFEAKSETAPDQRKELMQFIQWLNSPNTKSSELTSRLHADAFMQTMAVMLFSGAFDQLTGWNPHNYYLFRDSVSGRWRYLPWDLDVGFAASAFDNRIKVLEDWHAAWPTPPTQNPNPLTERIVSDPELRKQYRGIAAKILEKYFQPERLCGVLDAKYSLIREDLQRDPFPHRRVTSRTDRNYDDVVQSMREFIHARYASAKAQLATPGPRPPKPQRDNTPRFPPWVPPELANKLMQIHNSARELGANRDLRPVHEVMRKVGPLVHDKKVKEAEALVDEALKRLQRIRSK